MTSHLAPRRNEPGSLQAAWLLHALATLFLLIALALVIAAIAAQSMGGEETLWAPGAPGSPAPPAIRL